MFLYHRLYNVHISYLCICLLVQCSAMLLEKNRFYISHRIYGIQADLITNAVFQYSRASCICSYKCKNYKNNHKTSQPSNDETPQPFNHETSQIKQLSAVIQQIIPHKPNETSLMLTSPETVVYMGNIYAHWLFKNLKYLKLKIDQAFFRVIYILQNTMVVAAEDCCLYVPFYRGAWLLASY